MDTFNRVEIGLIWKDPRAVQTLTDCYAIDAYPAIKGDLDKSACGAIVLEIASRAAHENEPSAELYAALVEGLRDGTIDAIATDHAPHARHEKECPPDQAAFGIIGLEMGTVYSTLGARLEDLDGLPIVNINDVPLQGFNAWLKRAMDVALSAATLIVLSIPLALIAALIKWTSRGPVFYTDRKSTRLNSSHIPLSRMPSSA